MIVEEVVRIAIGLCLLFGAAGLVRITMQVKNFGLTPIEKPHDAQSEKR